MPVEERHVVVQDDVCRGQSLLVGGLHAGGSGYPNAAQTIELLRSHLDMEIIECGAWLLESKPLWRLTKENLAKQAMALLWLIFGNLISLLRVLARRRTCSDNVYVPYPSTFFLWWASWVPRKVRPRIVADAYISLWDSLVLDRRATATAGLKSRLLKAMERRALHAADMVLVDTNANKQMFIEHFGLSPDRVRAIPLAIDEASLRRYHTNQGPCSGEVNVLFVGTMIPLHGIEVILNAMQDLWDEPCLHFWLVGDGQLGDKVEQFVRDNNNLMRITWVRDWQTTAEVAEHVAAADICLGIFGGDGKAARVLPFKLYMYLASGKAVITQAGLSVPGGATNPPVLTIPGGDSAALADAIRRLLRDPGLRRQLSMEARDYYRDNLSQTQLVATWRRIFLHLRSFQ